MYSVPASAALVVFSVTGMIGCTESMPAMAWSLWRPSRRDDAGR